jgi:hypothetical protein
MNKTRISALAVMALAAIAWSVPAQAHPAVVPFGGGYVVPLDQSFLGISTGLPGHARIAVPTGIYYVTDDDFNGTTFIVKESNHLLDRGVLSYLVTETPSVSGLQLHDTCQGIYPPADVAKWQTGFDVQIYGYIPWQKTAVGFGDDAAAWKGYWLNDSPLHIDLDHVHDLAKKCHQLGGAFVPHDTILKGPFTGPVVSVPELP